MSDDSKTGLIALCIWALCIYGYFANVYKLAQCDFDTPMKAEVARGIGVVLFPVGIIEGYITIND